MSSIYNSFVSNPKNTAAQKQFLTQISDGVEKTLQRYAGEHDRQKEMLDGARDRYVVCPFYSLSTPFLSLFPSHVLCMK